MSNFDELNLDEFKEKLDGILTNSNLVGEKKKSIYLAGPWFDERAEYFLDTIIHIFYTVKSKCNYTLSVPRNFIDSNPRVVFEHNIDEINNADMILAAIPRKDIGTALEIGYAKGLDKKIVFVLFDNTDLLSKTNIMLAFAADCIITIDDLAECLVTDNFEGSSLKYEETWEDKE